ncbi:MAG: nodulation protein NfeD [Chloroflexi bacterium]|nr:nodulation protein NfeD [Chloroflexota bacterium]
MGALAVRGLAACCAVLAFAIVAFAPISAKDRHAVLLTVTGIIDPVTARYVERSVRQAADDGASLVVLRIDTPGGLDSAMRKIVQSLLNAKVPTVAYVSPSGSRAASAGVFITGAAHVAAMAPGTNLGAAHPVGLGEELPQTLAEKATNDAAALARSIATIRSRNAQWYEDAVRRSVAATADEAVDMNVVDLVARDLDELLMKLDGMVVTVDGKQVTLQTADLVLRSKGMPFLERLLHILADPNIAFILLSVGGLLILTEVFHPGMVAPGVIGVILLVLAFLGLGSLPINWAGVGLLFLGVGLLVAELFVTGFGVLGISGIAAFVVGGLLLFSPFSPGAPAAPDVQISLWVLAGITSVITLLFFVVFQAAVNTRKLRPVMVDARLIGQHGYATSDLTPAGTVKLPGEEWSARAADGESIYNGDEVEVVEVQGLVVTVRKVP